MRILFTLSYVSRLVLTGFVLGLVLGLSIIN